MTLQIHKFRAKQSPADAFSPDADRIVSGNPSGNAYNGYESPDGNKLVGEWQCSAGVWQVYYDEWEYCRILEGHVRLTGNDGSVIEAGPGDDIVIEPGFSGTWENFEPVRKIYVIDLAAKAVARS